MGGIKLIWGWSIDRLPWGCSWPCSAGVEVHYFCRLSEISTLQSENLPEWNSVSDCRAPSSDAGSSPLFPLQRFKSCPDSARAMLLLHYSHVSTLSTTLQGHGQLHAIISPNSERRYSPPSQLIFCIGTTYSTHLRWLIISLIAKYPSGDQSKSQLRKPYINAPPKTENTFIPHNDITSKVSSASDTSAPWDSQCWGQPSTRLCQAPH